MTERCRHAALFAAGLLVGLILAFPQSQAATAPAPTAPLPGLTLLVQPQPATPQSRAQPAQWYCRADCNACRRTCDYRYRRWCGGDWCRRTFTLCMRDCWNSVCRWC